MDAKEVTNQLGIQAHLGRTKFGRDLGEGMVELTMSSMAELNGGPPEAKKVGDCSGCGFMSSADGFTAGCPNCGCRDFKFLDVGNTGNNGGN